ncbi:hypothetical protein, partial [Asanoa sp. NPDC050611]|uniref:hypothetical protein n=1 Tax=Asanoa sp. NPDC050611 TaxID=3157098 RepID=UPI0033D480AA
MGANGVTLVRLTPWRDALFAKVGAVFGGVGLLSAVGSWISAFGFRVVRSVSGATGNPGPVAPDDRIPPVDQI